MFDDHKKKRKHDINPKSIPLLIMRIVFLFEIADTKCKWNYSTHSTLECFENIEYLGAMDMTFFSIFIHLSNFLSTSWASETDGCVINYFERFSTIEWYWLISLVFSIVTKIIYKKKHHIQNDVVSGWKIFCSILMELKEKFSQIFSFSNWKMNVQELK